MNVACEWEDDGSGVWETQCGDMFQFNDNGPSENDFKFCPYCGKAIEEIPYIEDVVEEDENETV